MEPGRWVWSICHVIITSLDVVVDGWSDGVRSLVLWQKKTACGSVRPHPLTGHMATARSYDMQQLSSFLPPSLAVPLPLTSAPVSSLLTFADMGTGIFVAYMYVFSAHMQMVMAVQRL